MISQRKILIATVILVALSFICALTLNQRPYRAGQEELAKKLGVQITDYPRPDSFPVEYFNSALELNMSVNEVHAIVKGYKKSFKCIKRFAEIYYYFSDNDSKALRIMIQYDFDFTYLKLITEDENSRTILLDNCVSGLFEK